MTAASAVVPLSAARADGDTVIWTVANTTVDIDPHHYLFLEGEAWVTDDASRLGQLVVRPAFGVRLNPTTQAMIGYTYVETRPIGGAVRYEHEGMQQLAYRLAGSTRGHPTLTGRTRLEERFVSGADAVGLRLRQQLKLTAPLSHRVAFVAWSEAYWAFNRTGWGQRPGIEQWRNFVGLRTTLSPHVAIEGGYMNQYLNRASGDRDNHVASLSLVTAF